MTEFEPHPARYWHKLADGRIQCDLCPRFCRLHEGQRGYCFVRARRQDQMVLTTYGRSSGFCVDPIEKKPLNHFLPGTSVLSFGTAGCNLACKFCQNWSISTSREIETLAESAGPEQIADAAKHLGCRSVAFTYNDPTIFHEYAVDVAEACREQGIKTVAVTAGYVCPEPRRDFYRAIDAANVDLKGFTDEFYRRICGAQLQPVLDTLFYLRRETRVWLEITHLMIPGLNDSDGEIEAMVQWIVEKLGPDVPLFFTGFSPAWKMRDRPATPPATLKRARKIALRNGVRYAFTGNIYDPDGESSYCHGCGALLIGRNGYVITAWNLDADGCCPTCRQRCAGVFEARPGSWGGKRLPVSIERAAPQHGRSPAGV